MKKNLSLFLVVAHFFASLYCVSPPAAITFYGVTFLFQELAKTLAAASYLKLASTVGVAMIGCLIIVCGFYVLLYQLFFKIPDNFLSSIHVDTTITNISLSIATTMVLLSATVFKLVGCTTKDFINITGIAFITALITTLIMTSVTLIIKLAQRNIKQKISTSKTTRT